MAMTFLIYRGETCVDRKWFSGLEKAWVYCKYIAPNIYSGSYFYPVVKK